jgi:hypothetical protein
MNATLKVIVQESIHPLLKSNNFKRSGLNWNRVRGPFIDVFTIQMAKYSDDNRSIIAINLGIAVPEFMAILWPNSSSKILSEAESVIRYNLGDLIEADRLINNRRFKWIEIDNYSRKKEEDLQLLLDSINDYAFSFYNDFKTIKDICSHLDKDSGWHSHYPLFKLYQSLCACYMGDIEKSHRIISSLKGNVWEEKAILVQKFIEQKTFHLD